LFAIRNTYFNMALDQIWTLNWGQMLKSAANDAFIQNVSKTAAWSWWHILDYIGITPKLCRSRCFENPFFIGDTMAEHSKWLSLAPVLTLSFAHWTLCVTTFKWIHHVGSMLDFKRDNSCPCNSIPPREEVLLA
jgi:hypothetical protein